MQASLHFLRQVLPISDQSLLMRSLQIIESQKLLDNHFGTAGGTVTIRLTTMRLRSMIVGCRIFEAIARVLAVRLPNHAIEQWGKQKRKDGRIVQSSLPTGYNSYTPRLHSLQFVSNASCICCAGLTPSTFNVAIIQCPSRNR